MLKQKYLEDNLPPERKLSAQIKAVNASLIEEINEKNTLLKQQKRAQLFNNSQKKTPKKSLALPPTMSKFVERESVDSQESRIQRFQTLYTTKQFVKNSSKAPLYVKAESPRFMFLDSMTEDLVTKENIFNQDMPFYRKYKELESQIQEHFGVHPRFKEEYQHQLQLCIELNKQNKSMNEENVKMDSHQIQMIDMLDRL